MKKIKKLVVLWAIGLTQVSPLSKLINMLHPNMLWCSSVTPPSITRWGDSPDRVHSFTHLSISAHRPTAPAPPARPHNTCHLIAWPHTSNLHLDSWPTWHLNTIEKREASYASYQYAGINRTVDITAHLRVNHILQTQKWVYCIYELCYKQQRAALK